MADRADRPSLQGGLIFFDEFEMSASAAVRESRVISIGLLAALVSPELEAFELPLKSAGWQRIPTSPGLKAAQIEHWQKHIADDPVNIFTGVIGRMGQAAAAIETFAFLERVKPSMVFLCGIAGSLVSQKFMKSDVVIAKHVHWKGENKIEDGSPCPVYRSADYVVPSFDFDTMNRLEAAVVRLNNRNELTDGTFRVHVEELFSWDYVTSGPAITAKILSRHPKAACVEMEAGGFLAAVERFRKIRSDKPMLGLVVRGISDYTESKDSDPQIRKTASRNAAAVCDRLAEDAFDPSGSDLLAQLIDL